MKILCLCLLAFALPCAAQQTPKTGDAKTSGSCSPAVTGNHNQFTIKCQGLSQEQGKKMLEILNKILANQIDPKTVDAKLDEILKAVNPNVPTKVYFCNGMWRTAGIGQNAGLEVNIGGDDKAFQEMARLNNTKQYAELLKLCASEIQAAPEWLTPLLFCGVAYGALGDQIKAKEMLMEFDSRTGPAYEAEPCKQISTYLRSALH
jgi:hypothetical protein